jgi:hypothetical protein
MRRNCLLKHVNVEKMKGRIEVKGRRGRRRKYLVNVLKEQTGYWKLKRKQCGELVLEEAVGLS